MVWINNDVNQNGWLKRKEGWLEPRSKLYQKNSTIGTHEAMSYCPMIDWKNKKDLITMWDVCDALVVSRPGKIVHKTIRLKSSLG